MSVKPSQATAPVSVLMAVYKDDNPRWFQDAVLSIFNQTLPCDELVVVVDGPVGSELEKELEIAAAAAAAALAQRRHLAILLPLTRSSLSTVFGAV